MQHNICNLNRGGWSFFSLFSVELCFVATPCMEHRAMYSNRMHMGYCSTLYLQFLLIFLKLLLLCAFHNSYAVTFPSINVAVAIFVVMRDPALVASYCAKYYSFRSFEATTAIVIVFNALRDPHHQSSFLYVQQAVACRITGTVLLNSLCLPCFLLLKIEYYSHPLWCFFCWPNQFFVRFPGKFVIFRTLQPLFVCLFQVQSIVYIVSEI